MVTGSGRGIGRAIALCLADEGARVVVNDIGVSLGGDGTDEDPAEQVVKEIESQGARPWPTATGSTTSTAPGGSSRTAVDTFGKIDILVNNAGIVRDRTLVKMDEADYDAVVAVHQKGTFNTARHAAPLMKEAGYGRIVNITSSAGLRGNFGQTNYGAAKAAIMGMTFVWAVELAKYGITVNAMAPGRCHPDDPGLNDEARAPGRPGSGPQRPTGRLLASEAAADVNGQIFGRTGYGYTVFQTPRQVATMWQEGGWTPAEVAEHFHEVLGQHLQPVGMPAHPLLGNKE